MVAFFVGLLFFIVGAVFIGGWRRIPADPPCKAVLTFFGRRLKTKLDEGWHWIFPGIYGLIRVNVERKILDITTTVRTPDRASSEIPIMITFRPLDSHLIEYLNSGQEAGTKKQLEGKIKERLREWAMSGEEGPTDWRELNKSQLPAISALIKVVAGDGLKSKIPEYIQSVPTWILLRYFSKPQPTKPFQNEQEWFVNNWQQVKTKITSAAEQLWAKNNPGNSENPPAAFTAQISAEIETAVEKRREEIQKLRLGEGQLEILNLGIVIERLNVEDIKVIGKVAEVADEEAKEQEERAAEEVEMKHAENMIKTRVANLNITTEAATELFQTQTRKVKKEVSEKKLNLSPETREMIKEVIPEIAKIFKKETENG